MMEEEDDDDIYAVEASAGPKAAAPSQNGADSPNKKLVNDVEEDEEEGEEVEEEGSDSVSTGIPTAL